MGTALASTNRSPSAVIPSDVPVRKFVRGSLLFFQRDRASKSHPVTRSALPVQGGRKRQRWGRAAAAQKESAHLYSFWQAGLKAVPGAWHAAHRWSSCDATWCLIDCSRTRKRTSLIDGGDFGHGRISKLFFKDDALSHLLEYIRQWSGDLFRVFIE